jgi:hypothetical protein
MEQSYIYILVLFIGLVAGAYLFNLLTRFFRSKDYQARAEWANFSEEEAENLLKRHGYNIIGKKVRANVITNVDGQDHLGYVVCDYLVQKGKKTFVAEVKSGQVGIDPTEPATRRQLLEYDYVYKPDGLLLVNMLDQKIYQVKFSFPKYTSDTLIVKIAAMAIIVLLVFILIWMGYQLRIRF